MMPRPTLVSTLVSVLGLAAGALVGVIACVGSPDDAANDPGCPAEQEVAAQPDPEIAAHPKGPAAAPVEAAETLVLSAVGDCTLGSDWDISRAPGSFHSELEAVGNDYRYPFSGVLDILGADDLTLANLEGTLTTATTRTKASLAFNGPPEFVAILKEGSVEAVNFANNHSHDFGRAGFEETQRVLDDAGVGVFGNGRVHTVVVKGLEIVNLGFVGGVGGTRADAALAVARHKRDDNFVIVSFHWGAEGASVPNTDQSRLGRAVIDAGADLVLGHHPHVLQGIEEYQGKRIVYSLGNFVFGGNSNPRDKDSMIYQEVLSLRSGKVTAAEHRILPVRISTATTRNDYRPVLLEGAERERVLEKVARLSAALPRAGDEGGGASHLRLPTARRER